MPPGGLHAMLMRLKEPLVESDSIRLTLRFETAGRIAVDVPILGVAALGPEK